MQSRCARKSYCGVLARQRVRAPALLSCEVHQATRDGHGLGQRTGNAAHRPGGELAAAAAMTVAVANGYGSGSERAAAVSGAAAGLGG